MKKSWLEEPSSESACCSLVGFNKQTDTYSNSKADAKAYSNTYSYSSIEKREFSIFTFKVLGTWIKITITFIFHLQSTAQKNHLSDLTS